MVVFDGLYKIMLALSSAKYNYNACQARQALEWSRVREQVPWLKHQKLILSAELLNTNVVWNVWGARVCDKEELTIRLSKLCCLYVCKSVSCYRTTSHLLTHWKRKSCPLTNILCKVNMETGLSSLRQLRKCQKNLIFHSEWTIPSIWINNASERKYIRENM